MRNFVVFDKWKYYKLSMLDFFVLYRGQISGLADQLSTFSPKIGGFHNHLYQYDYTDYFSSISPSQTSFNSRSPSASPFANQTTSMVNLLYSSLLSLTTNISLPQL